MERFYYAAAIAWALTGLNAVRFLNVHLPYRDLLPELEP